MRIIGLSGKIGTGKTTVASMAVASGLADMRIAFGDVLKADAAKRFGFDVRLCYEAKGLHVLHQDLPGGCMTVRGLLQWWGTDVCRAQDRYHWVKRMDEALGAYQVGCVVIDDVRFPEEAEWIRSRWGWLFRLEPYPGWASGIYGTHESETALESWEDWDAVFRPEYGQLDRVMRWLGILFDHKDIYGCRSSSAA